MSILHDLSAISAGYMPQDAPRAASSSRSAPGRHQSRSPQAEIGGRPLWVIYVVETIAFVGLLASAAILCVIFGAIVGAL